MLLVAAPNVFGDGGTLLFAKVSGPFAISVFSAPVPLRVGFVDISVLLLNNAEKSPVLDASVNIRLTKAGNRDLFREATHAAATNKLLYAALFAIPSPGLWKVNVQCSWGGKTVEANGAMNVLPAQPRAIAYWPYFAVVPIGLGLFALNQWLKVKRWRARQPRRP